MDKQVNRNQGIKNQKFTTKMQKKLVVLFIIVFLAFVGLSARLIMITRESGDQYKKQVLSQQRYDSTVIPYKRGAILDSRGTSLAISEKVYNVVLDAKALLENEEYLEPTLEALRMQFGFDTGSIRTYLNDNPSSQYYVLAKRLTYEEIAGFREIQADAEKGKVVKGIWFEEEYKRAYPNNTLACDLIGFTTSDNRGLYGLEEYYNDILSGTAGREYGYLNEDAELERTTIAAVDGNSIVTTIDANIQGIVEKYLKKFNEKHANEYHEGNGANNVGCIIMEVDTGNILAMASYPNFDLNDIKNTDALLGMTMVDADGKKVLPTAYINEEILAEMEEGVLSQNFNALWKNFCIVDTYEPGSVTKPFTVATGIESGSIIGNEVYNCEGSLDVGDHTIKCHNKYGDGLLSVADAVKISCNVCMMKIGQAIGKDTFVDFQHIFNFGLKTNVDLAGEARTASLVYGKTNMRSAELATCTFGQGFNTTMIQTITAFCSLVNGGNYYEPHVVSKIVSPTGATVQNIEPRLLKQTISPETSDIVREFCNLVVSEEDGTGRTARPAGYRIGGKTGTAETVPRDKINYVVSFMGYAPADNPQIAIYVVVDRPNVRLQDDAKYATYLVKDILTEVLPYLKIYMTEELSEKERADLEALQLEIITPVVPDDQTKEGEDTEGEGTEGEAENTEGGESDSKQTKIWKTFAIDPATGYAVDPNTGDYVDPVTGAVIGGSFATENTEQILPPAGEDTGAP